MKNHKAVLGEVRARVQKLRLRQHAAASPWLRSYPPDIKSSPEFPEKPLCSLLAEATARYADPVCAGFRSHDIRTEIPKTAVGKIQKENYGR